MDAFQEEDWPKEAEKMYERIEVLGKGSFGLVWMCQRKTNPEDEYDDEYAGEEHGDDAEKFADDDYDEDERWEGGREGEKRPAISSSSGATIPISDLSHETKEIDRRYLYCGDQT